MLWLKYCLLWNLVMILSYAMSLRSLYLRPLFPRPALFDMQLTSSIQVSVEFSGIAQDVHTTFTFHPHGHCVSGEIYNYTVLVWQEGKRQPCHIEGPFTVSSCERILEVTAYGLRRSQHYTATIVAYNENISLKSKKIDLYTSAVQTVEVVKGEECVVVTCYFARGSNALGCVVHMTIVNTFTSQHLHSWKFNVSQDSDMNSGTLHVPLEPKTSAVDVAVYDLSATGRVGSLSIPPQITFSSNGQCDVGGMVKPFRAKAKMVLFYITAGFFILGLLIVFVGMLCKIGKLHRHFHNKSYEILEGSSVHERKRSIGQYSQSHMHPLRIASGPRPSTRSYGSYEALERPAIHEIQENNHRSANTHPVSLHMSTDVGTAREQ